MKKYKYACKPFELYHGQLCKYIALGYIEIESNVVYHGDTSDEYYSAKWKTPANKLPYDVLMELYEEYMIEEEE